MGQRSQIYVRYEGNLLLARYYRWNYAERMISRARYGIEYMKDNLDEGYDFTFWDWSYIHQYIRIFDTNFDMKDVDISSNIFDEFKDESSPSGFCNFCFFKQDNNDGKLLVDISNGVIKYAFLDCNADVKNIMNATQYMDWDSEGWRNSEYIGEEGIQTCKKNIAAIDSMAKLMTETEVKDFLCTEEYYGKALPF